MKEINKSARMVERAKRRMRGKGEKRERERKKKIWKQMRINDGDKST